MPSGRRSASKPSPSRSRRSAAAFASCRARTPEGGGRGQWDRRDSTASGPGPAEVATSNAAWVVVNVCLEMYERAGGRREVGATEPAVPSPARAAGAPTSRPRTRSAGRRPDPPPIVAPDLSPLARVGRSRNRRPPRSVLRLRHRTDGGDRDVVAEAFTASGPPPRGDSGEPCSDDRSRVVGLDEVLALHGRPPVARRGGRARLQGRRRRSRRRNRPPTRRRPGCRRGARRARLRPGTSSTVGAPPSVSPFDATRLGWMPMWALASSPAYAAGDQAHEADGVTDAERLRRRDEGATDRAFAEEPSSLGPRCGRASACWIEVDAFFATACRLHDHERTRPAAWCGGSRRRRRGS